MDQSSARAEINLLSRKSILAGDIEQTAKRLAITRTAIQNLKQKQEELTNKFKEILIKMTSSSLKERIQGISSQLSRQAIELLEEKTGKSPSQNGNSKDEKLSVSQHDLSTRPDGELILCPSQIDGVEFLKKYNAWGFINISKEHNPKYFALYVTKPKSAISFFAEIESITQPIKSKEDIIKISEEDRKTFTSGKRVVYMKSGSLIEL